MCIHIDRLFDFHYTHMYDEMRRKSSATHPMRSNQRMETLMDTKLDEIVPCRTHLLSIVAAFSALVLSITVAQPGAADRLMIERGKHLVALAGAWTAVSPATASSTPT